MTIVPTTVLRSGWLDSSVHRGPFRTHEAEQYQRQLDAVADYIYASCPATTSAWRLAHVSGFSRYHWHPRSPGGALR